MKIPPKSSSPWSRLDAIMKSDPEPTGPEWFTAEQFCQRYGISFGHAHQKLRAMKAEGKVEAWKGTGADSRRTIIKYRLK